MMLLVVAATLLAGWQGAHGQDVINLYGGENVGTAGAQFLRIPVGARAVSLGLANTSCTTDASCVFWNPAGILRSAASRNIFFSHTEYTTEIDLNYLAVHWRGQNFGYGISAGMLSSGEIPRTDEFHQEGTDATFRADQYFLGLSVARAMTDRFSVGGTIKYYQENLDEFVIRTYMLDLGILYFVGIKDLRIGFSVRNFGPDFRPGGSPPEIGPEYTQPDQFQRTSAPTVGSFGLAYTFGLASKLDLLTTMGFAHPSDYSESFRLGQELDIGELLFLRAGYETNRDVGGFAAGFGVRVTRSKFELRLDYGYSDMGNFGTIHHFSLDLLPLIGRRPR
jgi:hypothetical protein